VLAVLHELLERMLLVARWLLMLLLLAFLLWSCPAQSTNVMCNDGTRSPTCSTCSSGCCSHHGGC
jgi:hypothetical protein